MTQPRKRILTPDQLKEQFRRRGVTFSSWARDHGYAPRKVLDVVNGVSKGHYGTSHEIAVKLGLKDGVIEHDSARAVA